MKEKEKYAPSHLTPVFRIFYPSLAGSNRRDVFSLHLGNTKSGGRGSKSSGDLELCARTMTGLPS